MKRIVALLVLGGLAPMLQSVAGSFVPPRFVPDLGFLFVVALGLSLRSAAGGVALAALLGFVTDLLSGSLLGQHALLRILAFGAARLGSSQVNLRGARTQAVFAGFLTALNALAMGALTAFFATGSGLDWLALRDLLPRMAVNALAAPPVVLLVSHVLVQLGAEESQRRPLRLAPRSWPS